MKDVCVKQYSLQAIKAQIKLPLHVLVNLSELSTQKYHTAFSLIIITH